MSPKPHQVEEVEEMMIPVNIGSPDVNAVILAAGHDAPLSDPSVSDEETEGSAKPRKTQKKKVKRKPKKVTHTNHHRKDVTITRENQINGRAIEIDTKIL